MNELDSGTSIDVIVRKILDNGEYEWNEFKDLLSQHYSFVDESPEPEDFFEDLSLSPSIAEIAKKYEDSDKIVSDFAGMYRLTGYTKRRSEGSGLGSFSHTSALLCGREYFYTLDSIVQLFGTVKYEFELGFMNHPEKTATIRSHVIFEGPESSKETPRIYLAITKNGKLIEKKQRKNFFEKLFPNKL